MYGRRSPQSICQRSTEDRSLPAAQTDYIGSVLWEQVISSRMRTVIAKLIMAPWWQLVLKDGSPDTIATGITAVKDAVARRMGENVNAFAPHRPLEGRRQQSGDWSSQCCLGKKKQTLRVCERARIIAFLVIPTIGHLGANLSSFTPGPSIHTWRADKHDSSTHAEGPWHTPRTLWDLG